MKKEYIIIITMGIILSFLIGFFINANFFGTSDIVIDTEHNILIGDESNIVGSWQGFGRDWDDITTFYSNGSYSRGNDDYSGEWQIVGNKIVTSGYYSNAILTYYFLDGYDKMIMEISLDEVIMGFICYRV